MSCSNWNILVESHYMQFINNTFSRFKKSARSVGAASNVGIAVSHPQSLHQARMAFGDYPAEYNPKVHGPYDPARFYGKPDTPFGQLKLSEIGEWFGRRNKSPQAIAGAVSRAWWRWQHKYVQPKRSGVAPFFQLVTGSMIFFYFINYAKLKKHRNYKYH